MLKSSTKYWQTRSSNTLKRSCTISKCELSQGCKDGTNQGYSQINKDNHINKLKYRNHMIIFIDGEKAFDKIQHTFIIKLYQSGNRGNIPQHIKCHTWKTYCQHRTQWTHLKSFALRSGTRQGCPLSQLLFNKIQDVLTTVITQEEIKALQVDKEEVKLSYLQTTW